MLMWCPFATMSGKLRAVVPKIAPSAERSTAVSTEPTDSPLRFAKLFSVLGPELPAEVQTRRSPTNARFSRAISSGLGCRKCQNAQLAHLPQGHRERQRRVLEAALLHAD